MPRKLAREEWIQSAWMILLGSWAIGIARFVTEEPSSIVNGGVVFAAVGLALGFWFLRRRVASKSAADTLVLWLMPVTVVVLIATADFEGIAAAGVTINAVPLVVLVLALMGKGE